MENREETRQWRYGPVHKHDHYNWHYVDTQHRTLSFTPSYPEKYYELRVIERWQRRLHSPYIRMLHGNEIDRTFNEMAEKAANTVGSTIKNSGGRIEIYLKKIFELILSWFERENEPYDESAAHVLFLMIHDQIYVHELLHLLFYWNSNYKENRARDKDTEEATVQKLTAHIWNYHWGY